MSVALSRPVLSLALLLTWLAANGPSVNQLILGSVLALLIPAALPKAARPTTASRPTAVRHIWLMVRFGVRVTADIVTANVAVARLVLAPQLALRPTFVRIPLRLSDPAAIALLANVISLTPGTVSADLERDAGTGASTLLVHALDADDPAALVDALRDRYEQPLLEIFGC